MTSETKRERALRLSHTAELGCKHTLGNVHGSWEHIERIISLARAEAFEEAVKMMRMGFDSGLHLTALHAVEQAAKEERDAD